jgi:hypothetical protein
MENNKNLVNGPVNGFRLEGKVGNINKVVYLFGDYHYPISGETKCDSFTSDDFINYFYKTMEKTDKNIRYDFIYENYFNVDMFEEYKYSNSRYREKYLDEIRKFVDSDMDIKEYKKDKQIKLENKGSKTFKNLRLHYLDVRSFFGRNVLLQTEQDNFYFLDNFDKNFQFWMIDRLIINFYNMKNHLNFLADHLSVMAYNKKKTFVDKIKIKDDHIQEEIKKYSDIIKAQEPRMKQYSEKMFKKYKNKEIKDKISKSDILITVLSHIKSVVKKLNGCLKKLLQLKEIGKISSFDLNKHTIQKKSEYNYGIDYIKTKKLFFQVKIKYEILYDDYIVLYAYLTDLYMLRRFLDKDYIEHAIVYTGMTHTQNYIRTLIKDFGFIITNLDYSKLSIKETNEVVPKKTVYELSELLRKPIFKQCVDMEKFPENFL